MNSKIQIYSVKDSVAGVFMSPFTSVNDNTAMRRYRDMTNQVDYKQDFDLYKLGSFDTSTGVIEALKSPELVFQGANLTEGNL